MSLIIETSVLITEICFDIFWIAFNTYVRMSSVGSCNINLSLFLGQRRAPPCCIVFFLEHTSCISSFYWLFHTPFAQRPYKFHLRGLRAINQFSCCTPGACPGACSLSLFQSMDWSVSLNCLNQLVLFFFAKFLFLLHLGVHGSPKCSRKTYLASVSCHHW